MPSPVDRRRLARLVHRRLVACLVAVVAVLSTGLLPVPAQAFETPSAGSCGGSPSINWNYPFNQWEVYATISCTAGTRVFSGTLDMLGPAPSSPSACEVGPALWGGGLTIGNITYGFSIIMINTPTGMLLIGQGTISAEGMWTMSETNWERGCSGQSQKLLDDGLSWNFVVPG
jgi:hypothetical protein